MVRFTVLSAVLCPAFLLLLPSLSTFSLVKSEEASLPGAAAVSLAEGVGGEEGGGRTSGGSSPADSADSADLTSVSSMSASESEPDTASSTASMEDASPSTPGGGGGEDAAAGGGGGAEDEGLEGIKMVHREHWSVIKAVQQKTFNWQWFYFPPKGIVSLSSALRCTELQPSSSSSAPPSRLSCRLASAPSRAFSS